jgi:DNA mismatch endonuclease (patch repair protein)
MPDRLTKQGRSRNMSLIRKFGNRSTELRMVALMRCNGIKGWRRHTSLPGTPDFAFRRERVAIFIDGCFWHGCPRCKWVPASNIDYWQMKFAMNRKRDRDADKALRAMGWKVIRVWEHSLKRPLVILRRLGRSLKIHG